MSEAPGNLNIPETLAAARPPHKHFNGSNSQRAVSMGALSDMHHQSTAMELIGLQKWHNYTLRVWIPLVLAIIIMSCMWADIIGKKGDYSDPAGSWQACLVNADYQYIPLNETFHKISMGIAKSKETISTCVVGLVFPPPPMNATCSLDCALALKSQCISQLTPQAFPKDADVQLPTGHFLDGFSYLGIQVIIFSSIAHAMLHRALRHPSWLLASIGLMCWFLFAIFTYYTVSPILPAPNGINSTFLIYLIYTSAYGKFNSFNNYNNHCDYALRVAWLYQSLILLAAVTVFVGIVIAIYAERIRYKSPNKPHYSHLKYTEAPVILSGLAALAYVFFIASKITSSVTELDGINNYDVPIADATGMWYSRTWFPFALPTLDITTIVGICCIMSVLRGFSVQSLSAFRLALLCSVVYAISIYPGLVGAYEFYNYNDFNNDETCKDFFLAKKTKATFGYPDDNQAQAYCSAFRMSIIAITLMAVAMHGIAIACAVCLLYNERDGRESLVHEVYDFDAASAFHDVSSARSSFALPPGSAPTGAAPTGPVTPKPLLSRANTKTGEPLYGNAESPMVATIENPMVRPM